jgi:transcriptional regulator with XRE-family HTH domain
MVSEQKKIRNPLRKKLGFSQSTYASYLGVSASLLSLNELGLRNLNGLAGAKEASLFSRWAEFEKVWTPSPPDLEEVEIARSFLKNKLSGFIIEREKRKKLKAGIEENRVDFKKSLTFLENELSMNHGEIVALNKAKAWGGKKIKTTQFRDSLLETLEDRFLDFQIAEYQRELDALGPEPPQ